MNIEFRYFGQTDKVKGHNGIAVVATKVDGGVLSVGFSLCHPKDNYSKQEGKKRALERLENFPISIPLITNEHNVITRQAAAIVQTSHTNDERTYYPPSWLKHIF